MKKQIKTLVATVAAILVGVGGVSAVPYESIDTSACETVYTNYYLFLDYLPVSYFDKGVNNTTHHTVAVYTNNIYLTEFNSNNIGYGQVDITTSTSTSSDGISSMSLSDFYDYAEKASNKATGRYTTGNSVYISHKNWFTINSDGSETYKVGTESNYYSNRMKKNATLNADSKFTVRGQIGPTTAREINIQIDRYYYGSLTGSPVYNKDKDDYRYFHPAVFYIQYCSPKKAEYKVYYHGNGMNVTNIPKTQTEEVDSCVRISKEPTREGYEFLGWSRRATSLSQVLMPGEKYCGGDGTIDLYAIWKKIEETPVDEYYTINYIANGSNVTGLPKEFKQNTKYDAYISDAKPRRSGYTFLGWSTDSADTTGNQIYAPGASYTDRKDLILYAIWKQDIKNPDLVLPDNPKTGITDYLLPFGGVISASGLGLGILKKKKNFKQF